MFLADFHLLWIYTVMTKLQNNASVPVLTKLGFAYNCRQYWACYRLNTANNQKNWQQLHPSQTFLLSFLSSDIKDSFGAEVQSSLKCHQKIISSQMLKMPHTCSHLEYANIVFIYGFCVGFGSAAVEEYHHRFFYHITHSRKEFSRVFNPLCDTGTLLTYKRVLAMHQYSGGHFSHYSQST